MVASLSSWLQSWPGPGETVEWLLSGLLLLHLLVILFFVFSRGNASAFLQWTVDSLTESNLPFLAELQHGAFQLQVNLCLSKILRWCILINLPPHLCFEGFSTEAFLALVGWTRARETVKGGCRDTSRWTTFSVWQLKVMEQSCHKFDDFMKLWWPTWFSFIT